MTAKTKASTPVAICQLCGRPAGLHAINAQCGQTIDGKRCKGLVRSALLPNEWSECTKCEAAGRLENPYRKCDACYGAGWHNTRPKY